MTPEQRQQARRWAAFVKDVGGYEVSGLLDDALDALEAAESDRDTAMAAHELLYAQMVDAAKIKEQRDALLKAATKLAEVHGRIAFAVGNGMNPRNADWYAADEVLLECRAAIQLCEEKKEKQQ